MPVKSDENRPKTNERDASKPVTDRTGAVLRNAFVGNFYNAVLLTQT
jgi:hypothetical protein